MTSPAGFGFKPRTIGELLDLTFRVYRGHLATLVGIGVTVSLVGFVFGLALQAVMHAGLTGASQPAAAVAMAGVFLLLFLLFVLMQLVVYNLGGLVTAGIVEAALHGRPTSLGAALRGATPRLPAALWTATLSSLVMVGGLLLCIVPGLIAGVLLALSLPVVYYEGKSGLGALGRSRDLVSRRGPSGLSTETNWVRVVVIWIVVLVIFWALSLLSQAPVMALGVLKGIRGAPPVQTVIGPQVFPLSIMLPVMALSSVVQGVFYAILLIPWPLLYFDIRVRHEGLDLERAVHEITAGEP